MGHVKGNLVHPKRRYYEQGPHKLANHLHDPFNDVIIAGKARFLWALSRLALGWVFLWAFLDKTFGLGYATMRNAAWIRGGSPTAGYLQFGTRGVFANAFQSMANSAVVEWIFMLGLLGIGTALTLGIGVRIASFSGAVMMVLMYLAVLPKENNPLIDDHVVYALVLIGLSLVHAGWTLGLGRRWCQSALVRRFPWLE